MRKRLTIIDPTSCAKVLAAAYGIIGLFAGPIFFVAGLFSKNWVAAAGISIIMPFGYALGGLIGGYLGALLYNLVAEMTGGLLLTLEDESSADSGHSTVVYSKPH